MRMSFDDEESFKEAVESLQFNKPASDPNAEQQMGSRNSVPAVPLEDSERNGDNIIPIDPITVRRVGSRSSLSIQETRRSGDIQICFNNPPSNSESTGILPNGV